MDDGGDKVSCVLCQRSEETKVTGALSTKDGVAAHQNCLLFSSGLFCRNSPQYDDLFGFSVEDVLNEVKRGSKLMCNKCKLKGATAGCEVKRCKKSYHYPCAVEERAEIIEDVDKGSFGLYCFNHNSQTREINGSINGHPSSSTKSGSSRNHSAAGPSKVFSPACKKTDGNNGLESVSNNIMSCYKNAPASRKRSSSSDSSAARQPTVYSSDSNSSGSARRSSSNRHFRHKQEGTPSKRKSWNVVMSDESSNSGMNEPDSEMAMFAPLEMDIEETANSVSEPQVIRKDTENPTCSPSDIRLEDESRKGNKDGDEAIIESVSGHISSCLQMDAESESLLLAVSRPLPVTMAPASTQTAPTLYPSVFLCKMELEEEVLQRTAEGLISENGPVNSPEQHDAGPSVPQQSSAEPPSSSYHSKPHSPPPSAGPAISPVLPETICMSSPESNIDSISFWKSCNAAECTQAIFNAFINEMNDISSRIQSDKASQEDCDRALKVMTASGKLAELVAKQQEELQKKQMELQKAAAAMKEIVSTLSR